MISTQRWQSSARLLWLAVSLLFAFDIHAAEKAKRPPNIIFILADDLGYGDLGCYGQKRIRTPHLDKLAADGIRFTQAYAGSTVCAPSRSCLMTGQHTGHTRIRGNALVPLRPEDQTVAELLKTAGYTTGLVGKWGLGEPDTTGIPNRQGFDYFFGYLNQTHAHNYYPDYLWRNEERVPLRNVVTPVGKGGSGVATVRLDYTADLFAQEAITFVEKNRAQPFFLYLALTTPHANNEAKAEGMEVPSDEPYTNELWPQSEKNKAAMITRMDRDIGQLLAKLDELGLAQDTIIFFTSDNGPHREGGNDPAFFQSSGLLQGIKRSLTEGGIRVPMIVRWQGTIRAGQVSKQVWAFWDFLPTAAELVGITPPKGIDGISIAPTLLGKRQRQQHEFLYWEFHEGGSKQAVRMDDWKGIRLSPDAPLALYRLDKDIGETNNLAAKYPRIVKRMETYLKTARTESAEWPLVSAKPKSN